MEKARLRLMPLGLFCIIDPRPRKPVLGQPPLTPIGPTLKIHISASRLRSNCTCLTKVGCEDFLYADAIVNGRKMELSGKAITRRSSSH